MARERIASPVGWDMLDDVGPRKLLVSAAALVFVAVFGLVSRDAAASSALPLSPTYLQATDEFNGLQVEPARITYTGDGTGFLGGAVVRSKSSGIRWTKWTATIALGAGFNQLNACEPDCGRGKFRGYPVRIELWRPDVLAGTLVFTRMTIFYTRSRPRGEPHHYTFTDSHLGGGYGWGPPVEQSYCVHTYGMAPAAGCNHIHELP